MKILLLFFIISYCSYAQESSPRTNPLANVLPPPVEKPYNNDYRQTSQQSEPVIFELSQNAKDYQYEQEHSSPLKGFEDDKIKFVDYNKPATITTNAPIQPESQADTDYNIGKIVGLIIGLIAVFLTFMSIIFTKRTKRF